MPSCDFQVVRTLNNVEVRKLLVTGLFNNNKLILRISPISDVGIFYQTDILSDEGDSFEGIYVNRNLTGSKYELVRVSEYWLNSRKLKFSDCESIW